ncbi:ABC transporter ATP-binding protein [Paraburkholderia silvatlantica]|uniref:Nucleoside ABC transporter ATP-binding protein n=1 Tax=Paraburkholderia silvatlantica TaxID=321895 RepID=A0A2U1AHQ0_9BURK|nr:ABC transporter ATP-binding protein [Paraburkholderia silvatlantica]MBB2929380.1 simple sugar transport system ATP-binding protein [Paraburkholderia silvatlantica]PVY35928.1 nucleoside ABC transporter ATP-binding protein [Paraburkholderia silvatlantica]PXW39876.1 nucleoside ABC transporter ATP-binding protein [Paraburkholderia silvatlantica]PYE19776.1 nucleoside ABC transporter ATP-binding protein [Paraburkholderia silvatlantica]TDQ99500.1 nucleoside ABC transporter ATP-binding protein [Par
MGDSSSRQATLAHNGSDVPRLALAGITKQYPAVRANDDVTLSVAPGEIHALLGENGAGKSTLMKIVYGAVRPDAGEIRWEGQTVEIASPAAARKLGIGMVFQHFSLFETLTVGENIALSLDEPFDLKTLGKRIREVSAQYGLDVDPQRHVHSLTVGERQRVEIVRCLLQNPRLLIMDEPTSVLTPQAVRKLFGTLRRLAAEGCSILYISHKLDEIQELCDTATVLRGGKVTGHVIPREETHASLARLMVGRELPDYTRRAHAPGDVLLEAQHLSMPSDDPFGTSLTDVSFSVHAGEILGIAGVSGNGQAELLAALSGEAQAARHGMRADAVRICGKPAGRLSAGARRKLGFAFVPEERLGRGAVPAMSLAENALLTAHREGMVRSGWLRTGAMRAFAERCIGAFDVRCGGPDALAQSLSGGNLQKYIVGREILQAPKVLVVAQPTWGVDVGAAAFIRQQLLDLSARGVAILVISEELEELFDICDRIAVLAGGRLSPARLTGETNAEEIGRWMAGLFGERADRGDGGRPDGEPPAQTVANA